MFGISVGGMLPLKTRFLLCLHEHWMMLATLFQSVAFLLAQQACGLSLSPFRHRNKRWSASPHLRALKLWQMELNQKSQTHKWWLMLCGSSWTTNSGNAKDATEHVLLPSSPFQFRTGRHFPVSFHFVQVLCRCWSLAEMLWWGFPPLLLCLPAYRFSRSVPLSLYRWPGMVDQWCSHASSFLCSYFLHWSDQNLMVISLDLCLTPPLLILIFAQDFHSSSSTPCTLKQYWKDRIFFWELTSDQWGYDRISCGLERLRFIPTPEICMAPIYQESLLPSWLVPDMQRTEVELTAQTLSLLGMMSSCSCERNGDTEIYIRVWSAKLITRDLFT